MPLWLFPGLCYWVHTRLQCKVYLGVLRAWEDHQLSLWLIHHPVFQAGVYLYTI